MEKNQADNLNAFQRFAYKSQITPGNSESIN
jgi:hypothetical protein